MQPTGVSIVATGVRGVPLTVTAPRIPPARQASTAAPPGAPGAADRALPRGAVIVVQEAFGVGEPIAEATRRLAAQGYLAVAPHLYHRVADAPVTTFPAARPLMATLNGDDLQHDLTDALDYITASGIRPARTAIIGFCMGGTVTLWAAARWHLAAAVTFYGGGVGASRWPGVEAGLESAQNLVTPWLGLYGDKDRSIKTADVERLREVAAGRDVPTAVVRYPQAAHAFATDPSSPKYVADAARDAWARALAWLDAHV